jgi:hypothetical protein
MMRKSGHYHAKGRVAGAWFVSVLCLVGMVSEVAFAQSDLIIYPNRGQGAQQQEKDKYECYTWAKQQTGFDPMAMPTASAPPPQKEAQQGGFMRGAVRGGAIGAIAGAIGDDAGKGAAIGAAAGGLIGGMRRRDQTSREQQSQDQWAQQQSAEYSHKRSTYNRAYGACLEGRGYTVK